MLIRHHVYVESLLDRRDRSFDLHFHSIARAANHLEPIGLHIAHHSVIVRFCRSKPLSEFSRGDKTVVFKTRRVINIGQKCLQSRRIAQRQNNIELHSLIGG